LHTDEIIRRLEGNNWLYTTSKEARQHGNLRPFSTDDGDGLKDRIGCMKTGLVSVVTPKIARIFREKGLEVNEVPYRIYASGSYFWNERAVDDIEIDVIVDGSCPFTGPIELSQDEVAEIFRNTEDNPVRIKINVFGTDELKLAANGEKVDKRDKLYEKLVLLPHEGIQFLGEKMDLKGDVDREVPTVIKTYGYFKERIVRAEHSDFTGGDIKDDDEKKWYVVRMRSILEYMAMKTRIEEGWEGKASDFEDRALEQAASSGIVPQPDDPLLAHHEQSLNKFIEEGELYEDKYRVLRLLGEGGMGAVYRVYDIHAKRVIALKRLNLAQVPFDQRVEFEKRFTTEAGNLSKLEHEGIVSIIDVFDPQQTRERFFTMESIKGVSLEKWFEGKKYNEGERLLVLLNAARALAYAHKKHMIHRDIKPENIMVRMSGDPALVDFGLAVSGPDAPKPDTRLTQPGYPVGTPCFMAPEQDEGFLLAINPEKYRCLDIDFNREKHLDYKKDIFSFGAVLYSIATGVTPFNGEDVPQVFRDKGYPVVPPRMFNPGISPSFETLIMRCMSLDPRERPDAKEVDKTVA
jgi:predicted Ser/Thr protein kinase